LSDAEFAIKKRLYPLVNELDIPVFRLNVLQIATAHQPPPQPPPGILIGFK
jgi:hypothetical protein